jgi:hypothetical protein
MPIILDTVPKVKIEMQTLWRLTAEAGWWTRYQWSVNKSSIAFEKHNPRLRMEIMTHIPDFLLIVHRGQWCLHFGCWSSSRGIYRRRHEWRQLWNMLLCGSLCLSPVTQTRRQHGPFGLLLAHEPTQICASVSLSCYTKSRVTLLTNE